MIGTYVIILYTESLQSHQYRDTITAIAKPLRHISVSFGANDIQKKIDPSTKLGCNYGSSSSSGASRSRNKSNKNNTRYHKSCLGMSIRDVMV